MIFDIEDCLWHFLTPPHYTNSQNFNDFIWLQLIFSQNFFFNFVYLTWKLHNRHFHNANMNLWENWSWLLAPCIKWPNWNTMHIFNARQQTVTAFTLWLKLHFSVQNLYVETYMSKSKCVFWRPSWITFRNLFNSRQTVKNYFSNG